MALLNRVSLKPYSHWYPDPLAPTSRKRKRLDLHNRS